MGWEQHLNQVWSSLEHPVLLSRVSRVQLCTTPQMAAHQAPLSLGFSKQEDWTGLAIPSPVHACMLRHFSFVQLCATPTRLLCPRESLGKNTGVGCYFLLCKRGRLYSNIILWMQSYKAVRKLTRFHNKYPSPYVYVKTGYPLQYILRTMFYRYYWKKKNYV